MQNKKEKKQRDKYTATEVFIRLSGFVLNHKYLFFYGIFSMVVYSIVTSSFPWILKEIIDGLSKESSIIPFEKYVIIAIGLLAMFIVRGFSYYWQNYIMLSLGQRLNRDLRQGLFSKLINFPFSYFQSRKTGDLIGRFTNDIAYIEQAFIIGVTGPVRDFTQVVLLLGYLWVLNFKLFLVSFSLIIPAGYLISYFGKMNKKVADIKQTKIGFLISMVNEALFGIRVVKAFNMENFEVRRFFRENTRVLKNFNESTKIASMSTPMLEFVAALYIIAIFGYGSYLINLKEITGGEFFSFIMAFYMIVAPLRSFNGFVLKMQEAAASARRIFEILDQPDLSIVENKKPNLPKVKNYIEIKISKFGYDHKVILHDIDIKIKCGQTVALVGSSGSGKTTLVNLIPRFYELSPKNGIITFDGHNIVDYSLVSLRQQIAVVTQETVLFNDTVNYNIAYGKMYQPQEKIISASKNAYAHAFIEHLGAGYKEVVGEKGMSLSGGQRQRIAIARAILKNAPVLILDEATNALDIQSEKEVNKALENLMKNRTTIVIAHKLSTIKSVDSIFVIKNGTIVEQGNFAKLMSKKGEFQKLYEVSHQDYIY